MDAQMKYLLVLVAMLWGIYYIFMQKESFTDSPSRKQINEGYIRLIFGEREFNENNSLLKAKCGDDPRGCKFFAKQ